MLIDPCELSPSYVRSIAPYQPGKPVSEVARELGLKEENIIKLASNENPLGPSPLAVEWPELASFISNSTSCFKALRSASNSLAV